jgi:hypothetical protein
MVVIVSIAMNEVGNYNSSPVLRDSNKTLPNASDIPKQLFLR